MKRKKFLSWIKNLSKVKSSSAKSSFMQHLKREVFALSKNTLPLSLPGNNGSSFLKNVIKSTEWRAGDWDFGRGGGVKEKHW